MNHKLQPVKSNPGTNNSSLLLEDLNKRCALSYVYLAAEYAK